METARYNKDFQRTAEQVRLPQVIYGNLLEFAKICMEQVGISHDEFVVFMGQINELVSYNSQMKSLTALLNKKFDPVSNRIRLENVQQLPLKYKLSVQENSLWQIHSLSSQLKSYKFAHNDFKTASGDTWNGIIWVPDAVWPQATEVRNVAEFYVFSGRKFIIKNIGTGVILPDEDSSLGFN